MTCITDKRTNQEVDFGTAVERMDVDVKMYLIALNAAEDAQEFFDQYCRMHREAFGTEF